MLSNIRVIEHSAPSTLGETPIYCDQLNRIIWVDIIERKCYSMHPETQEIETRNFPDTVSAVLPTTKKGHFLLLSSSGIFTYDLVSDQILDKLCDFPEDGEVTRPNEAQIAKDGTLFFGTMGYNAESKVGSWYSFSLQNGIQRLESSVSIPNTLCFNNGHVIFGDTATKHLFKTSIESIDWNNKQSIYSDSDGGMDGSYLTGENIMINARWGLNKCTLFDIKNKMNIVEEYPLPVTQPTSCVVVGNGTQNSIYFTSASKGLKDPGVNDGKLISATTTLSALPVNRFKL